MKSCYKVYIEYGQAFQTTNEDIIQSFVFGLGEIAKKLTKADFAEVQNIITSGISAVMSRPVTDENHCSFDNAVSSLGKLVYYQTDLTESGFALAGQFLDLLPLKFDIEESCSVALLLFDQIVISNPIIVNEPSLTKTKQAVQRINEFRKEEDLFEQAELKKLEQVNQLLGLTN